MTKLVCEAVNPPVCGNGAFGDIDKTACELYVPNEAIRAYRQTDQWKDFHIQGFFTEKGDVNDDGEVSMADANELVNQFLGETTYSKASDVNDDGKVSMADANEVVNMFLSEK